MQTFWNKTAFFVFILLGTILTSATMADDIVICDFESENYGQWQVEGEAFGSGPARGTLPNQMAVSGYEGKQLVNSFRNGDRTTGKLTSPAFEIQRDFISFRIGGGGFTDETCMRLLIDGKEVRQVTGDNVDPGGSEALQWKSWDVSDFRGKSAVIEIIDAATGGWGHINVDQITLTDTKRGPLASIAPVVTLTKTYPVERSFLLLPVKTGNPKKWVRLEVDGKIVREFDIELADEIQDSDKGHSFYATVEIAPWQGKDITIAVERVREDLPIFDSFMVSDWSEEPFAMNYNEPLRPQYHFSAQRGWINDPNGLMYYDGLYHLFAQHNPYGTQWGNMTWLHATSSDLLHWKELPPAIHPDELGTMFSGSGVVDHANTSGFQSGDEKPLVLIYTAAGGTNRLSKGKPFTQGIAYSTDAGKTWKKYEGNPVLEHIEGGNRDPKVFWHEPSKQWVMALYLDREDYALFGSPNLKQWEKLCDIRNLGCSECPDMFELAVDGDANNKKWVFWGGNGVYLIGSFDGKNFVPESKPLKAKYGGFDYAAQTWSDMPDGRRMQISWMNSSSSNVVFPGMPFNHQFTLPRELTLRTTQNGVRLCMEPAREVETLRDQLLFELDRTATLSTGDEESIVPPKRQLEIEMAFEPSNDAELDFSFFGNTFRYSAAKKTFGVIPVEPINGKIKLRFFLDTVSFEVFANDGESIFATCFTPESMTSEAIGLSVEHGNTTVTSLKIQTLKRTWPTVIENERSLLLWK